MVKLGDIKSDLKTVLSFQQCPKDIKKKNIDHWLSESPLLLRTWARADATVHLIYRAENVETTPSRAFPMAATEKARCWPNSRDSSKTDQNIWIRKNQKKTKTVQ